MEHRIWRMKTHLNWLWVLFPQGQKQTSTLLSLQTIPWVSPSLEFPDPPTRVHFHLWLLASMLVITFHYFLQTTSQPFWRVPRNLISGRNKTLLKSLLFCSDWLFLGAVQMLTVFMSSQLCSRALSINIQKWFENPKSQKGGEGQMHPGALTFPQQNTCIIGKPIEMDTVDWSWNVPTGWCSGLFWGVILMGHGAFSEWSLTSRSQSPELCLQRMCLPSSKSWPLWKLYLPLSQSRAPWVLVCHHVKGSCHKLLLLQNWSTLSCLPHCDEFDHSDKK